MSFPKDPHKCIQDAWYKLLVDFRAWYAPETKLTLDWKTRQIGKAIKSCPSRMVDDSEGMLREYRKSPNDPDVPGTSAFLPILLTATAAIDQPPDVNQILSVPYFTDVVVGDNQVVKLRTVGTTVRAQIAFFATNPHDARSISDQFCAYMSDDLKRRFEVPFDLGYGVTESRYFTVFENELFPTPVPSEAINISIFTVDATLVGHKVNVIGLGSDSDHTIDNGYNPDGSPKEKDQSLKVVTQADQFSDLHGHVRIKANPETGNITEEKIND